MINAPTASKYDASEILSGFIDECLGTDSNIGIDALPTSTCDLLPAPAQPTNRSTGLPKLAIPEVNTRGHERIPFDVRPVRASIRSGTAAAISGVVVDASLTGLWIDTAEPLATKSAVVVEWHLAGSAPIVLRGRVARCAPGGMGVRLHANDSTWAQRTKFIEAAVDPNGPEVSVTVLTSESQADVRALEEGLVTIGKRWIEVLGAPTNDDVHQAFISECLSRRRLDYATERYREMQRGTDAETASRYLEQVGKILAFAALQHAPKREKKSGSTQKLVFIAGMVVIAVAALFGAQSMLTKRAAPVPESRVVGQFMESKPRVAPVHKTDGFCPKGLCNTPVPSAGGDATP